MSRRLGETIAEGTRLERDTEHIEKRGRKIVFSSYSSEYIFSRAWETGYIRRTDWECLCIGLDEPTHDIAARLLYAIRRGRLAIVD